jgi:hypothetical protein
MSCFHWFKQLPHMIFGATNARFCCVPSGLIGNAQRRDAGNVVCRRSYIFTSRRHDNVLPAKACCGPRNRSRRDQAGTQRNGRNLIVTIILVGECGLSLVYSER